MFVVYKSVNARLTQYLPYGTLSAPLMGPIYGAIGTGMQDAQCP